MSPQSYLVLIEIRDLLKKLQPALKQHLDEREFGGTNPDHVRSVEIKPYTRNGRREWDAFVYRGGFECGSVVGAPSIRAAITQLYEHLDRSGIP